MALQLERTRGERVGLLWLVTVFIVFAALMPVARASAGDRLPEFRDCVKVCKEDNCNGEAPVQPPLMHRALLWTCPAECDQSCQQIITRVRRLRGEPVVQFHGKWPFRRVLGLQEPLSVLFSLGNLWAHAAGLRRLRQALPASFPLRAYYGRTGLIGLVAWTCSTIFHARDFRLTEHLDYLAAGAAVLHGLHYVVVRVARLDRPTRRGRAVLHLWTVGCLAAYAAHVGFLELVRWDYGYNMAANIVVGVAQNLLWSVLSVLQYRRLHHAWTVWPGIAVAWVVFAMSAELFDFPPIGGFLDAHSLWHLGTIGPTVLMYNFLVKDSLEIIASTQRLKA